MLTPRARRFLAVYLIALVAVFAIDQIVIRIAGPASAAFVLVGIGIGLLLGVVIEVAIHRPLGDVDKPSKER